MEIEAWALTLGCRYKQYVLGQSVVLRNKAPKWNEAIGAFCLNFGGRVTHASVKNFQLVSVDNMVCTCVHVAVKYRIKNVTPAHQL